MQLATWNVNSLKMRLQHVLDWLAANPVDFLCLQETKLTDDKFPKDEIEAAGYGVIFTGQPTYNGVALLYRKEAGYVPEGVQLTIRSMRMCSGGWCRHGSRRRRGRCG